MRNLPPILEQALAKFEITASSSSIAIPANGGDIFPGDLPFAPQGENPAVETPAIIKPPPPTWRDHVFTAAQLRTKQFPEISYVVPGLIPEGLTLIAGRPKIGKSWLAYDIAITIAAGRICLGDRKPVQGDVLYAALEDNPRRLQRRIDRLLSPFNAEWPERLTLSTVWRRLDKGGIEDIQEWIQSANNPRFVILDTLAGVKPIRTTSGYTEDYQSLERLHRVVSDSSGIGCAALHHTRKLEAEDPIDTVSGTLGLSGVADTIMVLNRTSKGTTLYVRGRDIEEAEHAVMFNKETCRWSILGDAAEVQRSGERGKILAVLLDAEELMTPQDIVNASGMPRNNVDQLLYKMTADGEIMKAGRGKYFHPTKPELNKESKS